METLGQTIVGLCEQFSASLDRDVIDKTGVAGAFDIHLDLTPADLFPAQPSITPGVNDPARPVIPADPLGAITSAVQKLGLTLKPAQGTGEFLVIDHVQKPSGN